MTAHLTILGGGSIGCFLGFALAGPTLHVTVLSRPPIAALAAAGSMAVFKLDGERLSRSPNLQLVDSMDALPERTDGVLVTTKVHDLAAVVSAWMARAPTLDVPIWGLQNGLRSHAVLAEIGVRDPRAGSVTFNVVRSRERWTQTTSGALLLPAHPGCRVTGSIHARLRDVGLSCALVRDIDASLRGKLVLNLNNGICASTGLTIRASILDADARRCYQLAAREALQVFRAADLPVARVGRIPPSLLPWLLPLPTPVITRLAPALIKIDPGARSSTLQDLQAGRRTEVHALHGAVVDVARRHAGLRAPVNQHLVEVVDSLAERHGPLPFLTPHDLLAALRDCQRTQS